MARPPPSRRQQQQQQQLLLPRLPLLLALAALPPRARALTQALVQTGTTFDPFGLLTITMAGGAASVTNLAQAVFLDEWRPPLSGVGPWFNAQRIAMPTAAWPTALPLTLAGLGFLPTPYREGIGTTAMDGATAVFAGYAVAAGISNPQGTSLQRTVATVNADGSVLLTQVPLLTGTVTRGAAAFNGATQAYLATDTAMVLADLATGLTTSVGALTRPYQPIVQGAGVGDASPSNWALFAPGYSSLLCALQPCNGLYGFGGGPPLPTAPATAAYQPGTDRGGTVANQTSNQAGWFFGTASYFACDSTNNEFVAFSAAGGGAWTVAWTISWGAAPCYSVTGRVEAGHTILYVVVGGGATERASNAVHRVNATTRTDTGAVFVSPPTETFRSAFLSPCTMAAQGALGLACPMWSNGVAYVANSSSGGVPTPSPSPTPSITPSASLTPSATSTVSMTSSGSPTISVSASIGASASPTISQTPSVTPSRGSQTPSRSYSSIASASPRPNVTHVAASPPPGSSSDSAPRAGSLSTGGVVGVLITLIICIVCVCIAVKRCTDGKGNSAMKRKRRWYDVILGTGSGPPLSGPPMPAAAAEHPIFAAMARSSAAGRRGRGGSTSESDSDEEGDPGRAGGGGVSALQMARTAANRDGVPGAGDGGGGGGGGGKKSWSPVLSGMSAKNSGKFGGGGGGAVAAAGPARAASGRGAAAPAPMPRSSLTAPMSDARAAAFARAVSGELDPKDVAFEVEPAPAAAALPRTGGAFGNKSLMANAAAPAAVAASRRYEVALPLPLAQHQQRASSSSAGKQASLRGAR